MDNHQAAGYCRVIAAAPRPRPAASGGLILTAIPMKTRDTKKESKKQPTKTAKEKKLAKQEKKNSR